MCGIPWIGHVQNRDIHRDRKQIRIHRGLTWGKSQLKKRGSSLMSPEFVFGVMKKFRSRGMVAQQCEFTDGTYRWLKWLVSKPVLSSPVTQSGVRLLAPVKLLKRQGWQKGSFALFRKPAVGGGEWAPVQGRVPCPPHPTDQQWT